ncbi:hypothetical protein HanPSC8_Chr02g0054421 [Helianthus annuus]|nr:hypothetical protein HanPSC8_Chr02g0054421 [Helianthus annuus]
MCIVQHFYVYFFFLIKRSRRKTRVLNTNFIYITSAFYRSIITTIYIKISFVISLNKFIIIIILITSVDTIDVIVYLQM